MRPAPRFRGGRHNARSLALQVLLDCRRHDAFVQEILDQRLGEHPLPAPDRRLATQLAYGVLRRRGDMAGAESEYRRVVALIPCDAFARNNLGDMLRDRGDLAGAESEYRRAASLKPDDAEAHFRLGENLQHLGRLQEALVTYRRAHELGSKQPNWGRPSAEVIRHCERLIALHRSRLAATERAVAVEQRACAGWFVEELRDIFMDFETGLNATVQLPARWRYPAAA